MLLKRLEPMMEIPIEFKDSIAGRALLAAMIAIAIAFAALYCRAVSPYWKLTPDSTTYVLGAQSLANGNGYREAGSPAVLFPPGTSALLAAGWIAGGKHYRALNAEVMLFAFASLVICFLLFRDSLGRLGSGVVVLLCLGSTVFFERSTFLLSEIFFVFFSLLALWWYERDSTTGAVLSALAACLVRSVGVSLAAALLLDSLRKRPRRWSHTAAYALPLLFAVLWELRNRRLGVSYIDLMTENEPWVPASGHISAGRMVSRLFGNFAYGHALEDLLTNGLTQDLGWWAILPGIVLGALFTVGFWRLFRDGKSAAGIYFILFSITVALYWPSVVVRLFIPVLPLMFGCLVAGVQQVAEKRPFKWVYALAALVLGLYLTTGFREEIPMVADERRSPFPNEHVKYTGYYDTQAVALWWKAHAAEGDIYACEHPNVIGIITGRTGVAYVATGQPEAIENGLRSKHARFLLLNLSSGSDQALALVADRSAKFRLTKQEGRARLYELADWPPR
jgi:hypothetical protein